MKKIFVSFKVKLGDYTAPANASMVLDHPVTLNSEWIANLPEFLERETGGSHAIIINLIPLEG